MSELARRNDWNYPAARDSVDTAQRETTGRIYRETNRVFRQSVESVVSEAKALEDPQTRRYVAPFVEESTRQFGHDLLRQQAESTAHVEGVAKEWRRRIMI